MTEQSHASSPSCPWCSHELPSSALSTCPSCSATLIGEPEAPLPGVTAVDAEAIVRNARNATPQRRSRLMSWITGEEGDVDDAPARPGSLEPPPPEVRREMLRMELEAEVLDLQAEAEALAAEARDEGLSGDAEALEAAADDAASTAQDVAATGPDHRDAGPTASHPAASGAADPAGPPPDRASA